MPLLQQIIKHPWVQRQQTAPNGAQQGHPAPFPHACGCDPGQEAIHSSARQDFADSSKKNANLAKVLREKGICDALGAGPGREGAP